MAIKIPKNLKKVREERKDDGKVNTSVEMVNASEEALWEKNPSLLYTSPSPRDAHESRMPSSA